MSKTITSGGVAFIDLTDSRKLDAYITSNLPTTQIYNQNTKTYTPNWSSTNLKLSADIYLDSKLVTSQSYTSIIWYQKIGTQARTQVGTGSSLTVNGNQLSSSVGIITYICEATYDDTAINPPTAHAEIVFTRVDTGLNGSNGADGTSVTIDGTAYYNGTLTQALVGQKIVLYADTEFKTLLLDTKQMEPGDSYIVQGYLCVYSPTDKAFICTGTIQGPKGDAGENAKNIILSGNSQVFKVGQNDLITPTTITVIAQALNTNITAWSYSTNGGQTFLSTAPDGVSRSGNTVTISGKDITSNSIVIKASDGEISDVFTIYKVADGINGERGANGDAAPTAFLTNENITFSANAEGKIATTTITSNVVAYNGTEKVLPILGTITGVPDGMTISTSTISASNEVMLTISVANNSTLGSSLSNMGTINIPIISPVSTVLALSWSKVNDGAPAVSFQIYAPTGYLLTSEFPSLTLNTFACEGNVEITNNATYVWYSWADNDWAIINGATNDSMTVSKTDVLKSNSYKCEMTYKNQTYSATATVEDKTDVYDSLIRVNAKYSTNNTLYWILYATIYSEDGERDTLLGPISDVAPIGATVGSYWYKIDNEACTVTLMKYSGTVWETTTDTQELQYDWFLFKDVEDMATLGQPGKVKIVVANDFTHTCNVQCNISDSNYLLLSRNNQALTDPSDPIVSNEPPSNPSNGQIWIRTNSNGSYMLSVWDSSQNKWTVSDADSQNKVYTAKPINYTAGDIWIVDGDYQPTIYKAGVAQTNKYAIGTMLKAQYTAITYQDADWVEALSYKEQLSDLQDHINTYNQYFSFDESGVIMTAKDSSGNVSDFKTKLTNTELGFYQGNDKVAHINDNTLIISKAQITNELAVIGDVPIVKVGNFILTEESNGSFSISTNL